MQLHWICFASSADSWQNKELIFQHLLKKIALLPLFEFYVWFLFYNSQFRGLTTAFCIARKDIWLSNLPLDIWLLISDSLTWPEHLHYTLSLIVAPLEWVLATSETRHVHCQLLPITLFPHLVPAARPLVLTDSCILSLATLNALEVRSVISATKLSKSLTLHVLTWGCVATSERH